MVNIITERMTAELDDEFVVFLIGMRINHWWKIHKWLPVSMAMPKMLKELYANPELGFISQESWFGRTTLMVQYWKSFEHLEAYAKNRKGTHLPEWVKFNKKIGHNGDVGIWHETYLIKKGCHDWLKGALHRIMLDSSISEGDFSLCFALTTASLYFLSRS